MMINEFLLLNIGCINNYYCYWIHYSLLLLHKLNDEWNGMSTIHSLHRFITKYTVHIKQYIWVHIKHVFLVHYIMLLIMHICMGVHAHQNIIIINIKCICIMIDLCFKAIYLWISEDILSYVEYWSPLLHYSSLFLCSSSITPLFLCNKWLHSTFRVYRINSN